MSDPEGKYEKAVADGFTKWPRADTQGKPFTYGE